MSSNTRPPGRGRRLAAARKGMRVLARPVRRHPGGIVIEAYRGYGNRERTVMLGRVVEQARPARGQRWWAELTDAYRRLTRRPLPRARVQARLGSSLCEVVTDPDGYFELEMPAPPDLDPHRLWHPVLLQLPDVARADGGLVEATGEIYVPPRGARFVVISDIDDTVVYTGVRNKLKMLWTLFAQGAESRVAFPGVAAFYRALHHGAGQADCNPLLYVSRGPWSLYEVLDTFFHLHGIPVGPILFLRDWGISLLSPVPRRAVGHKRGLIERMLEVYPELPFVLIGDSGQRDPEIYFDVVRRHPRRIMAVYIRNISRGRTRAEAIRALARQVVAAGGSMVLADDTFAMARHAAEAGLIEPEALEGILAQRAADEGGAAAPSRQVEVAPEAGREETRAAVESGAVERALEEEPDGKPPSVTVKAERRSER